MPLSLLLPMSLSGATGQVAVYVEEIQKDSREPLINSTIFGTRRILEQLDGVYEDCFLPGWDGNGAKAISHDVLRNARHFLGSLPFGMELPEISAKPDGAITFEWYRSPKRTLSVSINPDGYVYYAFLMGASRRHGVDPIQGGISKDLIVLINQVLGIRI